MVRRKTKRTGSHTFQKTDEGTPLPKGLNISRIEKNSDTGKVITVTGPEMDRMVHILLSLKERRFYYMIPISAKSSKQVYMQINKLHKFYGDSFKDIFKSITFDNG